MAAALAGKRLSHSLEHVMIAASLRQRPWVSAGAFVTKGTDVVGYRPFLGIATV
jgi:hypothetical protein